MKISIIHASRGRPDMARETRVNWMLKSSGKHEIEYLLSVDNDDPTLHKYRELFNDPLISDNKSAVQAFNTAAEYATGDIIVAISDDFSCPESWGDEIVKHSAGRKNWIMKTQDGTQGWIITLPIMDRPYYESQGHIYFPEYRHMFADTDLTTIADLTGRKITTQLKFPHDHYTTGKSKKDAVSERADSTWNQGEALYLKRYRENFGLRPDQIKGKIESAEHLNWMKNKMRRIA